MSSQSDRPRRPKKSRRKGRGKPHNAGPVPEYRSLAEIIESIATQERLVPFAGGETMMSRRERSFRIMIEKALDGQPTEIARLLRLMAKYPELAATVVPVIIIRGGLCGV